jgi:hypothetical protein
MALTSSMGIPSNSERGTGSYAGTCEDEHGYAPQGQIVKIVLHWSPEKIVNITTPPPLCSYTLREGPVRSL